MFTWTPSEAQGPGSFTFDVEVTDDGTPTRSDSETITVTVDEVDTPPVLAAIGDQTVDEGVELTFTATASDPDAPSTLTYTLAGAPAGAAIDPVSGVFTWTPSEAQGPGSYTFDIEVTDNTALTDTETITVTVAEVNVAPLVVDPGDQTDPEGGVVSLFIAATDTDLPANTLTFGAAGLPAGLSIDPASGEITGTLSFGCAATSPHTVTVTVTDNGTPVLAGQTVFDWTCTNTNQAPTLDPVGDHTIDEGVELTFTATASDPDVPADTLSFSLAGEPTGAVIDPASGVFTWTPSEAQGPGSFTFDVEVTDDGTPTRSDSETITVTVDEVDTPPVLAAIGDQTVDEGVELTFTATASDPDAPSTLTYTLAGAPAGAAIDPVSGVFTWTPSEAQGPGSYTFDIEVTDNTALTDTETITVTVAEVNVAPLVVDPGDQTDPEGGVVSLFIAATDTDLPANTLTFGAAGLPAGLSIDPASGEITGTLSFGCAATSPHTVTVTVTDNGTPVLAGQTVFDWTCTNTNQAPTLDPVGDHTIDEGVELTFTATASDPDVPADTLSFSLAGEPTGAVIDPASGVFTWTPSEAQGPGSFTFDVEVTDDGTPTRSDSETITVTVDEVDTPPVLAAIGDQTVDEGVELTFTATASDPDAPSTLTYTLAGAPAGAAIDPVSGVFTWTPSEAQGPGSYTFDIEVTDNTALTDTETITVTVLETNQAPILAGIGNLIIAEQTLLNDRHRF